MDLRGRAVEKQEAHAAFAGELVERAEQHGQGRRGAPFAIGDETRGEALRARRERVESLELEGLGLPGGKAHPGQGREARRRDDAVLLGEVEDDRDVVDRVVEDAVLVVGGGRIDVLVFDQRGVAEAKDAPALYLGGRGGDAKLRSLGHGRLPSGWRGRTTPRAA